MLLELFQVVATEETTFSDSLQRETEMMTGPHPGIEIDIAEPKKYLLGHRILETHSKARTANSHPTKTRQIIQMREVSRVSGDDEEIWRL